MARIEVNKQHKSYTTVLTTRHNHPAGESVPNSTMGNKVFIWSESIFPQH